MTMKPLFALLCVPALAVAASSCMVEEDNADRFREAIPSADDVKLKEPTGGSASSTPQSLPGLGTQDTDPLPYAKYYKFTRDIFDGVNWGTGYILGSVWVLVHLPPTTLSGNEAIWGPASEALSPAEWRFRAVEVADGEIEYFFEGHRKDGSLGDSWLPTLHGKGFSKKNAKHRQGWFELDYDAANQLDPARLHGEDEAGKTTINYALTSFPITVNCKLEQGKYGAYFDIVTTTQQNGGGLVDIKGKDDLDASKATKLEDIHMHSRWLGTGAGRADVTLSGGDIPNNLVVNASECWSTSFARTYYSDTIASEPVFGAESACPYLTAEYE